MQIEIFDVEHGACALITADTGARMMIDCGHNGTTGWRPSAHLAKAGVEVLDGLVVANCDEDHVSDLPNLITTTGVRVLHRNPTVTPQAMLALKADHGFGKGVGTLAYISANLYTAPVTAPPNFGAVEVWHYWNHYPWDFLDENNLSMVTIVRYHNLCVIFPGDLEKAGWLRLLERESFRRDLGMVSIFIASHHGRLDGYCREVFDYCFPEAVIFSDQSIEFETQETASLYNQHARGVRFFDGRVRRVLTTRNNGAIRISQWGPGIGWVWISQA